MKKIITLCLLIFSVAAFSQKHHHQVKKDACPVCKSVKTVIPIVYGKPAKELQEKAERGEVKLGGCVISATSPKHYCLKDKKEF